MSAQTLNCQVKEVPRILGGITWRGPKPMAENLSFISWTVAFSHKGTLPSGSGSWASVLPNCLSNKPHCLHKYKTLYHIFIACLNLVVTLNKEICPCKNSTYSSCMQHIFSIRTKVKKRTCPFEP